MLTCSWDDDNACRTRFHSCENGNPIDNDGILNRIQNDINPMYSVQHPLVVLEINDAAKARKGSYVFSFSFTLLFHPLCAPSPFYFSILFKCSSLSSNTAHPQCLVSVSLLCFLPSCLHACLIMSLLTLLKFFIAPLLSIFHYSLSFPMASLLSLPEFPEQPITEASGSFKKEHRIESHCLCQRGIYKLMIC